MSRSIKNLTFTLVLALGGLGLGGCAGVEETELVDETAEAVELGDGTTLQAASDVDDDDPAVDKVIDIGGAPVDSGGLEVPGADKTEPEPEPWTGPFGGHRVRQDHGDRDTDAEAKHMNAI